MQIGINLPKDYYFKVVVKKNNENGLHCHPIFLDLRVFVSEMSNYTR